jgi:hypothetical protein
MLNTRFVIILFQDIVWKGKEVVWDLNWITIDGLRKKRHDYLTNQITSSGFFFKYFTLISLK